MNFEVVKSRVKLFGQHDVLTWNIADTDALYRILRSGNAITLDDLAKTKNHWRHYLGAFRRLDKHHRQQLGRSFRCLLGAMAGSLVQTH